MPNPVLNTKSFSEKAGETQPGWGAPTTSPPPAPDVVSPWPPPPTTTVSYAPMTIGGAASATGVLITLLLVASVFGWMATVPETGSLPAGLMVGLFGGIGLAFLTIFKPTWARVTAPLYALFAGCVVGAISHVYNFEYDGIVLQAVGLTICVFLIMLGLFATGRIKVTEKLRLAIIASTGAIFLVYMVSIIANLFGGDVAFINDAGIVGIGFSLLVVGVASMNLLLDFDFVQRAVA